MGLLSAAVQKQVQEALKSLDGRATLAVFVSAADACEMCADTRRLAEEVAALSDGAVTTEVYDIDRDAALAHMYRIDKVPAIAVFGGASGRQDFGIRFFGAPAGYEFGTLIEDIRLAGSGATDLAPATLELLRHLDAPLHIQVFVTPTCPYCPRAVLLAHKMAIASDRVTADAIDATEFPDLADRYEVRGVPRTVVNGTVHVEGAVPERALVAELLPLIAGAP